MRDASRMSTQLDEQPVPADTLALRLGIARLNAGHHNVAAAALACGISRQTWSNWERGKPMSHRDANLALIARTLNVSEAWLREGGPLAAAPPDGDPGEPVRHRRLERRTRWFGGTPRSALMLVDNAA